MESMVCSGDERVVRAIRSSDWDSKKNRWSSNLFTGPETSVSRLKILDLKRLFKIFFKQLHKPPVHKVQAAGEIEINHLQKLGNEFELNGRPDPRVITVIEKKLKENPAHAEIREKLPRSLSHKIIEELKIHNAPNISRWVKLTKWVDSKIKPLKRRSN